MDCLPNMDGDDPGHVANATSEVLAVLEAHFPGVPILVLEGHDYTNNWIKPAQAAVQKGLQKAQASVVAALRVTHPNLHYASSVGKLGDDLDVVQDSTSG